MEDKNLLEPSEGGLAPEVSEEPIPQIAPPAEPSDPISEPAPSQVASQLAPTEEAPIEEPVQLPPAPTLGHPNAQDYNAEDMASMHDVATRQIHPKTMEGMFANQNTMGKIGTLFGLMLSGAGSGLAHQSNAVLDMMNNVIKNDLESQKSNITNAQNFLTLSFNHELQQAQIRRSEVENWNTQVQALKVPEEIKKFKAETFYQQQLAKGVPADIAAKNAQTMLYKEQLKTIAPQVKASLAQAESSKAATAASQAQTKKTEIETEGTRAKTAAEVSALQSAFPAIAQPSKPSGPGSIPANEKPTPQMPMGPHPEDIKHAAIVAPFRAKNQMLTAMVQDLGDKTANNPQAQAVFQNTVLPAIQAEQQNNNAQADAASQINQAQQDAPYQDVVSNRNALDQKMNQGRMFPNIPGGIPEGQAVAIQSEIAKLEKHRADYAAWADSFRELQMMKNAGQLRGGAALSSIIGGIGTALGTGVGAFLGHPAAGAIAGGITGNIAGKSSGVLKDYFERARSVLVDRLQERTGKDLSSVLPSWNDQGGNTGKVRAQAWKKGQEEFKNSEMELAPLLKGYGLKSPFPEMGYDAMNYMPTHDYSMNISQEQNPNQDLEDRMFEDNRKKFAQ